MKLKDLIAQLRGQVATKLEQRNSIATELGELRAAETVDEALVAEKRAAKDALDSEIDVMIDQLREAEAELERDEAAERLQREVAPAASLPAYDRVARVGSEERTYHPGVDRTGKKFAEDVAAAFMGDRQAAARIDRHMAEERIERGMEQFDRAVGTGAFSGLVVPQYLVGDKAGFARADRPLADAIGSQSLPEQGMVVQISKLTTGSSVDVQSSENSNASETDVDDTLLTVNIQTAAGRQTVSRQGSERGVGIEETIIEDLVSAYRANLDSKILNQATNGLTNVATSIAYTDASPTAAELYPKLLAGPAAVEAALLDSDPGDTIAVMHSRRWYWLQSQLTSTWPLFGQPGAMSQQAGANYAERYGAGFRGVLPSGVPVVVDNNIATNLGAGTNEDEIYFVSQRQSRLWEDTDAPVLIRAEQTKAESLGIVLVVYGYFAYTWTRRASAQKIAGTGLVTPTF